MPHVRRQTHESRTGVDRERSLKLGLLTEFKPSGKLTMTVSKFTDL